MENPAPIVRRKKTAGALKNLWFSSPKTNTRLASWLNHNLNCCLKCRGGGLNSESGWFISCDTNKTTHRSIENYLQINQRHGIELIWYNSTIEVTSFAARTWRTPCPLQVSYGKKYWIGGTPKTHSKLETVWSFHFKWTNVFH